MMEFTAIPTLQVLEGVKYKPYKDSGGKWTVGCGHLIVPGDGCSKNEIIGPERVETLLKADVQEAVDCVNKCVTTELTQNQFDALVIFVFNIGISAFRISTLLQKLNAGDIDGASKQFARWNRVGGHPNAGLDNRRAAEKELFLRA
jgi:lysozyme